MDHDHLYELMNIHQKKLRLLEKQKVLFGSACPIHILMELEQVMSDIRQLETQMHDQLECPTCKKAPLEIHGTTKIQRKFLVLKQKTRYAELHCHHCGYQLNLSQAQKSPLNIIIKRTLTGGSLAVGLDYFLNDKKILLYALQSLRKEDGSQYLYLNDDDDDADDGYDDDDDL